MVSIELVPTSSSTTNGIHRLTRVDSVVGMPI